MFCFFSFWEFSKIKDDAADETVADAVVERELIGGRGAEPEVDPLRHDPWGAGAQRVVAAAVEDDADAVLAVAQDVDGPVEKDVDRRSPGWAPAEMRVRQSRAVAIQQMAVQQLRVASRWVAIGRICVAVKTKSNWWKSDLIAGG